jgi:hypothetical protein
MKSVYTQTKITTMKLSHLLVLPLLLVITVANSQKSSLYLKGGLNIANISTSNDGDIDDANSLASFHAGLMADLPLSKYIAIQPSLLFTGKGAKVQNGSENDNTYFKATSNPYYVELPVNLVFKIPFENPDNSLFLGAGPYVAMGVAGKNKVEGKILGASYSDESSIDFSNDDPATGTEEGAGLGIMRRFDWGFNGTAGFQLSKVLLSVNYGLGMAKLQSGADNSEDNKNKHRVLSFSLGFRL